MKRNIAEILAPGGFRGLLLNVVGHILQFYNDRHWFCDGNKI